MDSMRRKTDDRTKQSTSLVTAGTEQPQLLMVDEGEKCLVGIVVDGVARGTGFILNTGLVITCRHVLLSKIKNDTPLSGNIRIRFIIQDTLNGRQKNPSVSEEKASAGEEQDGIVASLQHSCERLDLALLKINSEHHPAGAIVALLASNHLKYGDKLILRCFHRSSSDSCYKWDRADGRYVNQSCHPNNGQQEKFTFSSVTKGYSGAPVFDCSYRVVGIAANINRTDENGRGGEDNYFIGSDIIRDFAEKYLPSASVHESRDKALRDSIIRVIECSKVTEDLREILGKELDIERLCQKLLSIAESDILSLARTFGTINCKYKQSGDAGSCEKRRDLYSLYFTLMSVKMNPQKVRELREILDIRPGHRIPIGCSDRVLVETLMAGVCGRKVEFIENIDDPNLRGRFELELQDIPEEGEILWPGDSVLEKERKVLFAMLRQVGSPAVQQISPAAVIMNLKTILASYTNDQQFFAVVVGYCSKAGMRRDYSHLQKLCEKHGITNIVWVESDDKDEANQSYATVNLFRFRDWR